MTPVQRLFIGIGTGIMIGCPLGYFFIWAIGETVEHFTP